MTKRSREISANLEVARRRIAKAAEKGGRSAEAVTVVAVTKFFPASDVRILADLGVCHIAENKHQEAVAKREECVDLVDLTWHFVGALQSNKAAAVARWADVVESVDRDKLVSRLAAAEPSGLDVLIQVNLDPPGARSGHEGAADRRGVSPEGLLDLLLAIDKEPALRLRGLMAVAPHKADPEPAFARLAALHRDVERLHPEATWLSAGMSGDLEPAVKHGATHVRLGSSLLGIRPPRR